MPHVRPTSSAWSSVIKFSLWVKVKSPLKKPLGQRLAITVCQLLIQHTSSLVWFQLILTVIQHMQSKFIFWKRIFSVPQKTCRLTVGRLLADPQLVEVSSSSQLPIYVSILISPRHYAGCIAPFFILHQHLHYQKLNFSPIDELGNWYQERLVEGPMEVWGTVGRFLWRPCEREPALQAAINKHGETEGTSVEKLTWPDTYHEPLPRGGKSWALIW